MTFENPTAYFGAWRIIYIFVGLSGLFYFGALALSCLLLPFTGRKKPGAHDPVRRPGCIWTDGVLAVVFLVECCIAANRFHSIPISLFP